MREEEVWLCDGKAKGKWELTGSRVLEKHGKKRWRKNKLRRREREEETHWKGQVSGPKAASKRCIYFEKMENDMYNNTGEYKEGEKKHWNVNFIFCKLYGTEKTVRCEVIFKLRYLLQISDSVLKLNSDFKIYRLWKVDHFPVCIRNIRQVLHQDINLLFFSLWILLVVIQKFIFTISK